MRRSGIKGSLWPWFDFSRTAELRRMECRFIMSWSVRRAESAQASSRSRACGSLGRAPPRQKKRCKRTMYHSNYMPRQSAIIAASSVFGPVLGELPDSVVQWMALPEPIKTVQVDNQVMFHWAKYEQKPNDMRGDTGTYQWVAKSARATLSNPYALNRGKKPQTYQIIGRVEAPGSQYQTIQYFRLLLKYVPSAQAHSGKPEMWLATYNPHSQKSVRRYLIGAQIVGT
jgi:hypothetical protein